MPAEKKPDSSVVIANPAGPEAALRGERGVDADLLDTAVREINRLYITKGLETYLAIGGYVLQTFFGGDPESFRQRGDRHVTFRLLAQREDLHLSYSSIAKAVGVVGQITLLPEPVAAALPYTHHTVLLPIRDPGAKVELAERAADEGWPSRRLIEEVLKIRQQEKRNTGAGRPPLPAVVKLIRGVQRVVDKGDASALSDDDLQGQSSDVLRPSLSSLREQIQTLEDLQARIEEVLQARE